MTALLRCGQLVYIALHLFPTIYPKRHINGSVCAFSATADQGFFVKQQQLPGGVVTQLCKVMTVGDQQLYDVTPSNLLRFWVAMCSISGAMALRVKKSLFTHHHAINKSSPSRALRLAI